jgi:glycerophosphoryl diester phosphodiesterase
MTKPLLIYHRGLHGNIAGRDIQENTIEAFEAAVADGAKMIEFDVWTGLRVAHDPGNNNAPTLPEVLGVIGGRAGVNIEIKSPAALEAALQTIRSALKSGLWTPEKIVVSSFHHASAIQVKNELPELRVGIINDGVLDGRYLWMLRQHNIQNLHMEWANIYMDRENGCLFQHVARIFGFEIWVWTVNKLDIFETMVDYGVDAVFTDRPDLFK